MAAAVAGVEGGYSQPAHLFQAGGALEISAAAAGVLPTVMAALAALAAAAVHPKELAAMAALAAAADPARMAVVVVMGTAA